MSYAIVKVPVDLKNYSILSVEKFEELELYVFNG